MKRPAVALAVVAAMIGACQSPNKRLLSEIDRIRQDAGDPDATVKVLAILAPEKPPIRALAALNEPKNLYLATFRFVTAIITARTVTLYHRGLTRSYDLKPRYYYQAYDLAWGWQSVYQPGDRDVLADELVGESYSPWEKVVVCDLRMNPIDVEEPRAPSPYHRSEPYPTVLAKYSKFEQAEYDEWLKTGSKPEIKQPD